MKILHAGAVKNWKPYSRIRAIAQGQVFEISKNANEMRMAVGQAVLQNLEAFGP